MQQQQLFCMLRRVVQICLMVGWLIAGWPVLAQVADISMTKNGPTSAFNGQTVTYTLNIINIGPSGANGTTFSDTLPAGLSNVSATCTVALSGAVCPSSITTSASSVSGSIPTLPANGAVTIVVTARLPVGGTDTSLTNTASANPPAGVIDPVPSSNTSFINTALTYRDADLAVTKQASAILYTLGSPLSYTVTLTNLGPGPADGTQLRDRLTAQTVGAGLAGGVTATINSLNCTAFGGAVCPSFTPAANVTTGNNIFQQTIPTLPSGSSVQFVVQITPAGYTAGTCGYTSVNLVNTVDITNRPVSVADPVATNNTQATTATGVSLVPACPQADVGTTKTAPAGTYSFGLPLTYTIAYFNNGPGAADGTVLRDNISLNTTGSGLFPSLVYSSASISCTSTAGSSCPSISVPSSGTITSAASLLFANTATLFPPGGRITLTYVLTPTAFGSATCGYTALALRNVSSFTMPAGVVDPGGANSSTIDRNSPVRPNCIQTDISTSKTLISGQVGQGQTLTYLISVSNIGTGTATDVVYSDTIVHNNLGTGIGNPYLSLNQINRGSCNAIAGAICPVMPSLPPNLLLSNAAQTLQANTTITLMPPGSSISYTVSFVVSSVDASCRRTGASLENRITLQAPNTYVDLLAGNNTAAATTPVNCADLSTLKSVTPTSVASGGTITFTFEITNVGPATATDVVFNDPLPAGFAHFSSQCSATSGGAVCGSTVYTASPSSVDGTVSQMPPNSSVRYIIVGTANALPGSWRNQGSVRMQPGTIDQDTGSNSSAVSFSVTTDFPSIAKLTTRANSSPSGTTGYIIVVSNPVTGLTLTNVSITDLLPAGWTYQTTTLVTLAGGATRTTASTPTLGAVTPSWGSFTFPPTGSSAQIQFVANIPASAICGQTISNQAQVTYTRGGGTFTSTYLGLDPGLTSDDVTLSCPAAGIAKRLLSQADNGDGSFTLDYALRFKNTGSETLNPVQIVDPLASSAGGSFGLNAASNPPAPGQYRIASAPSLFGACAGMAATGSFNGANNLIIANGSMTAGLECELRFSVQFGATATNPVPTYSNQAQLSATGTLSASAIGDVSDDGSNPDPASNNGQGGVNDPTLANVTPTVALSLTKTNGLTSMAAGQTTLYSVIVNNAGPSGVVNAVLRDFPSAGLVCTTVSCSLTSGAGVCPTQGNAAGQLSVANLAGAGVLVPRLNSASSMQFDLSCEVTATGLP